MSSYRENEKSVRSCNEDVDCGISAYLIHVVKWQTYNGNSCTHHGSSSLLPARVPFYLGIRLLIVLVDRPCSRVLDCGVHARLGISDPILHYHHLSFKCIHECEEVDRFNPPPLNTLSDLSDHFNPVTPTP